MGKVIESYFFYINCRRGCKISELKATEQIIVLLNGKKRKKKVRENVRKR
jgi:hypothetical protein